MTRIPFACKVEGILLKGFKLAKKLTQEDFITRSINKHGKDYDYSLVEYINNSVKVKILCKKHGNTFEQSPNKHMSGQGCPICRYEKTSKSNTATRENFISKAISVHGDTYGYDNVVYIDTFTHVEIFCKVHGETFLQKPANHISGSGCQKCAEEKVSQHINSLVLSTDEFVSKANQVHGDLYDYSETVYVRSALPVKIWCNTHEGFFSQTANSHLAGIGCASCAKTGYKPYESGSLYVLQCGDITKLGITNNSPDDRANKVSKSYGGNFSVKHSWEFEDGSIPDEIETTLLRELRKEYNRPLNRFEGSSECFLNVDHSLLLNRIHQEITLRTQ